MGIGCGRTTALAEVASIHDEVSRETVQRMASCRGTSTVSLTS
ncbi:hypothetical protein [Actinomadura alba]|nr:hypothetical protein [Actinomadura alba]